MFSPYSWPPPGSQRPNSRTYLGEAVAAYQAMTSVLATQRAEQGVSLRQLAALLGLSLSTVTGALAGWCWPSVSTLAGLADVLGLHLNVEVVRHHRAVRPVPPPPAAVAGVQMVPVGPSPADRAVRVRLGHDLACWQLDWLRARSGVGRLRLAERINVAPDSPGRMARAPSSGRWVSLQLLSAVASELDARLTLTVGTRPGPFVW